MDDCLHLAEAGPLEEKAPKRQGVEERVMEAGGNLDHLALITTCPRTLLPLEAKAIPPTAPMRAHEKKIKLPIKPEQLKKAINAIKQDPELSREISALAIEAVRVQILLKKRPGAETARAHSPRAD